MSTTRTRYNDTVYRRLREQLRQRVEREGLPCVICGRAIDLTRRAPDPLSFSADHVHGIADGGHLHGQLAPTHYGCNSSRGGKQGAARRAARRKRYSYHEEHPAFTRRDP